MSGVRRWRERQLVGRADERSDGVQFLGALVAVETWWIGNDLGDQERGIMLDGEDARIWADPA